MFSINFTNQEIASGMTTDFTGNLFVKTTPPPTYDSHIKVIWKGKAFFDLELSMESQILFIVQ